MKQSTVRIICWVMAGMMLFGIVFTIIAFFFG